MMQRQFCSVVAAVERWVGKAFHRFLQLDVRLGSVQDFFQRVTLYFTRCLYNGWVTRSLLMKAKAMMSSLQLCTLAR